MPDDLLRGRVRLADEGGPTALGELIDADERGGARSSGRPAVAVAGTFPVDHTGRRYPWPLV